RWLHDEWGVPLDYYDGERVAEHHGFISHRSLIQTGDPHSDYWPPEEWAAMTASTRGGSGMAVIIKSPSGERLLAGPLFTGVSAEQLASLRAQGVPTLELAMNQAGEDV